MEPVGSIESYVFFSRLRRETKVLGKKVVVDLELAVGSFVVHLYN